MPIQTINIGTTANDGTGDSIRDSFGKSNDNFTYLDSTKIESSDIANFETTTELNARDTANRARANHTGTQTLSTISDAGTAAALNVPVTGDAAVGEVVKGNDSRLTDARTPTSHTHTASEITDFDTEVSNNASVTANTAKVSADGSIDTHSDVNTTGKTNGNILIYNSTSGNWEATAPTGGGDMLASTYDTDSDGIVEEADQITGQGALATLNTVGTTQIDNNSVTFAKIEDIATNRILGRSTAGTGDIEALADGDVRGIIGLATTDSPQFAGINVGHATDTTIGRTSAGVINVEGNDVLMSSNIGSSVQGYDANTAKYNDTTANFTGTLQNGGSNVVVDSDIGVNVQAYSSVLQNTTASFTTADKTKLDGIEAGADVTDATNVEAAGAVMDSDIGVTVQAYDANNTTASNTQTLTNKTINGSSNTITNVSLTTGVTGTLPVANGGTGKTTLTTDINAQTGTTYTLVLSDASKLITLANASAITLTIPTNASVAFPVGTQIDISQDGAGAVTVGGAGVTINSKGGNKTTNGQYVGATLIKTATDTWNLYGDLIA